MNNDCTLQPLTCVDHNLGVSSCHTRDYVSDLDMLCLYMLVPVCIFRKIKQDSYIEIYFCSLDISNSNMLIL